MANDQSPTLAGPHLPRLAPLTNPLSPPIDSLPVPNIPGYTVLGELGRGSMGVVSCARHHGLNRQVALKMLLIGAHADPGLITRFYSETQTIAKLQHPGIVQVFDSGWCGGLPYCALEFLSGGTLADRLTGKPWAPRKAAELILTLARSIHTAHEAGVVHRDLKPANILFDSQERPKITDFGVAKDLQNPEGGYTQSGDIIGTPSYMAPEQAGGSSHRVGPAADTYALGVMLYELLTGDVPFVGPDPLDVMLQVRQLEPIPPRRRVHSVPGDLDVICIKCLEKEPGRRYASAQALGDDLQRYLNDQPIQARRVSDWEKLRRWGRRNPLVAGLLTCVVGIFLAAFILVSFSYWRAEHALFQAETREKAERWERYRANIAAAATGMQLHNVNLAREALAVAPPEHRNWEWHHFNRQLEGAKAVHRMPTDTLLFPVNLPFGSAFRLVHDNQSVLWDADRNERIKTVALRPSSKVYFSPDQHTYAVTHPETVLTLHDLPSDKILARIDTGNAPINFFRFSEDSRRVCLIINHSTLQIHETRTGKLIFRRHNPSSLYQNLHFSWDGCRFLFEDANQKIFTLMELETGRELSRWVHPGNQLCFAVLNHAGDRLLLAGVYPDVDLHLWNTETGTKLATLRGHENQVFHAQFTRDDRLVASGSIDQSIRIWDGHGGESLHRLQGHRGWVQAMAFSPDGTRLVSGSQDHTLRLWDTQTGACLGVLLGHTRDVEYAAYSADGTHFYSWGADSAFRVWNAQDVERKGVYRGHTDFVYGVAVHPDSTCFASAAWDGTVRVWDVKSSRELHRFRHTPGTVVHTVAFSADGTHLASAGRDHTVRVWNLKTGQEARRWEYRADSWRDCRIAFCPRGRLLAVGDTDRKIHLWDLEPDRKVGTLKGHEDAIRDLAFSPDGRWLVSSGERVDPHLIVWDVASLTPAQRLPGRPGYSMYSLAFNRSGSHLAAGSMDGTVLLWDTSTWQSVGSLPQGSKVYSVAFSPDESRLAAACANGTIRLWDMARRQEVGELTGHDLYVHQLAFSPDGTFLASVSGDRTVRLWDTLSEGQRRR